jgi:hypothetical protein
MSVYVGIDVHRKRSRVAAVAEDLLADVLARISKGDIRAPAPQSAPLAEAERLLRSLGECGVAGKFVLDPR